MGFPMSHQSRFYAAPNFLKMGMKYLIVVFWTISTIQDEKSAAKFQYIKTSAAQLQHNQLPFKWYQYIARGTTSSPEILAPSDLPTHEGSEF